MNKSDICVSNYRFIAGFLHNQITAKRKFLRKEEAIAPTKCAETCTGTGNRKVARIIGRKKSRFRRSARVRVRERERET